MIMSCLFSTSTCLARLYSAWFCLFSNTTESHLSLGGVVIARQPERAVMSFACRTNTTQKWRTWRWWHTCSSVSDHRVGLCVPTSLVSKIGFDSSWTGCFHDLASDCHSLANRWLSICWHHIFDPTQLTWNPGKVGTKKYLVNSMENSKNLLEFGRGKKVLVEKGQSSGVPRVWMTQPWLSQTISFIVYEIYSLINEEGRFEYILKWLDFIQPHKFDQSDEEW